MTAARTLIKGGHIVTMDDALGDFGRGDVLIEGKKIAAVGALIDERADETIDASGQILIPGLIDTHIHLWELPMRGISHLFHHNTQYATHIHPRRGVFGPDDVYAGVYAGALELISNGTTTVLDFCHCINSVPHGEQAVAGLRDAGIRGIHGHAVGYRSPLVEHASDQQRFDEADRIRQEVVQDDGNGLLSMMIALSDRQLGAELDLYAREVDFARKREMRMTMHSIQDLHITAMNNAGLLGSDCLTVHGTQLNRQELDVLARLEMPLSFTPSCEYKRDLAAMLGWAIERGIQLSWGVDVPAYVDPDLFAQMRLVTEMQQHHDAVEDKACGFMPRRKPTLSARDVLKAGTSGGAKSIGLEAKIGSLTPGKEADIVFLGLPLAGGSVGDICSHIIFQSGSRDVESVMIAGTFRKRNKQMLNVDVERVRAMVEQARQRVMSRSFTPRPEWNGAMPDWRNIA
jgi:cytosine/adenosine deaminase-related metal-dependent hydrolase